jgi:hypothetical protein
VLGVVVGTTIGTGEITDPGIIPLLLGSGLGLLVLGTGTPIGGVDPDDGVEDSLPELVPVAGVLSVEGVVSGDGLDSVDGVVVELLIGVVDN